MKQFDLQGNEYDCQLETLPKEITGVVYHMTEKSLLEDWREEALRHRGEIERLKEEYVMLQNASDEVEDKLREEIKNLKLGRSAMAKELHDRKEEIKKLDNRIAKLEQENVVLKTQVVNKDRYTYGIR